MSSDDFVVRCRGLPWSCTEDDLRSFFSGLSQGIREICFTYNSEGRATGEAFVQLGCENDYQLCLAKDREKIGKRYIEIFPSKKTELDYSSRHNKEVSKNRSLYGSSDCIVRLRGLPYGCWEEDIAHFFSGLEIAPNGILLVTNRDGKQTGEGFVQFTNMAAYEAALRKNKETMGHRYIEVFGSSYDDLELTVFKAEFESSTSRGSAMGGGGIGAGAGAGGGGGGGGRMGFGRSRQRMGGDRYFGRLGEPFDDYVDPYERMAARRMDYGGYGASERYSPYAMFHGNGSVGGFRRGGYGSGAMSGFGGGSRGGDDGGGATDLFGFGSGRAVGGGAGGDNKTLKHYVFLRGLPFKAGQEDIVQFFQPLRISGVQFTFDAMGRPSGEARVEFFTHADALDAMKRDRKVMGDRYVELFLSSESNDDEPAYMSAGAAAQESKPSGLASITTPFSQTGGSSFYSDFMTNKF